MRMITFTVFGAISKVLDCPTNTNEAEKCSHLNDISFDRTDEIIRMRHFHAKKIHSFSREKESREKKG